MSCYDCKNEHCDELGKIQNVPTCKNHMDTEEFLRAELAAKTAECERLKKQISLMRHDYAELSNTLENCKGFADAVVIERNKLLAERKEQDERISRMQESYDALFQDRERLLKERNEMEAQQPVAYTNNEQLGYLQEERYACTPMAMWARKYPDNVNIPLYTSPRPVPAVPEGWQLVPKESTPEMRAEGRESYCNDGAGYASVNLIYDVKLLAAFGAVAWFASAIFYGDYAVGIFALILAIANFFNLAFREEGRLTWPYQMTQRGAMGPGRCDTNHVTIACGAQHQDQNMSG